MEANIKMDYLLYLCASGLTDLERQTETPTLLIDEFIEVQKMLEKQREI